MNEDLIKEFERDILKKYRKELWSKFIKAIKKYDMIQEGDKIAIAMSGGKDSLLMAKLFQELKKHPLVNFDIEFISMDPGFNKENLDLHFGNAYKLGVPVNIEKSQIFKILETMELSYPCYMCARMRRGFLYNLAQEKGCNKLALGHHFDDVIETTLMNVFYAGTFGTMLPKVKSENFEGIEIIRPLYLIKENDIQRIMNKHNIETMDCGCEMQTCDTSSKRYLTKKLIKKLKEESPDIDKNIFRSAENVNLDNIYRYMQGGEEYIIYDKDKKKDD
jgi:tRNA(Ile)-lysidine synthase TilS/MesJ